jgi:hypothetical protein
MQQLREECMERRAKETAAKIERAKKHQERMDQIKRMIVDATVASGEEAGFGDAVVAIVEERGSLLKVLDENEAVDAASLREFILEAKRKQFESKMMMVVPWALSEQQKLECVKQVLEKHSVSELRSIATFGRNKGVASDFCGTVWKDALESAMQSSSQFTCPICMDPLIQLSRSGKPITSNMWYAPLYKNEHWSNQPCGHACCRACMGTWAETSINDGKVNVRCPAPGCAYSLFDHDLQKLVTPETFERHQEHKNADYLRHLRASLKEDVRLNSWLKANARPCPDCHVIVSRSEGCDHMKCICGTSFCYACGFKKCKCNQMKRNRRDIWKPK